MTAAVTLAPPFTLRYARDSDLPFIIKPWLQQLRDETSTRHIPDRVFFQRHGQLVKRLLTTAPTRIACDAEDADHLYGFACGGPAPHPLHWVYVKGTYRGMGIGRALLASAFDLGKHEITCSHASHVLNDRALVARYKLTYDPYVLMENL